MTIRSLLSFFSLICLGACLDPYKPPEISTNLRLLVVDGFVNTTAGSIQVRLSRSDSPSSPDAPLPEKAAQVSVSTDNGDEYFLTEGDSGIYLVSGLSLNVTARYRLHVETSSGTSMVSEEVVAKQTPPIDSITWDKAETGVNVYVNTHDPTGKTQYYLWDYTETWEYLSPFTSYFKDVNGYYVQRVDSERVERCWRTVLSTSIKVGNSGPLEADVIRNFPLQFIPKEINKLSIRYSIMVRQRAIDETTYRFYQQLQKTTELHGGLFDPLPSRVLGNLKAVGDSSTYILGYFSAGSVQEKRIFIDHEELPERLKTPRDQRGCIYRITNDSPSKQELVLYPVFDSATGVILGYAIAPVQCADCRKQGGSLTRPDYW